MNGSQLAVHVPASPTHNTGGMSFGNNPFQTKQRKTAKFHEDGSGGIAHNVTGQRFRMLPGGRWVEITVYQRFMSKERMPGDPW